MRASCLLLLLCSSSVFSLPYAGWTPFNLTDIVSYADQQTRQWLGAIKWTSPVKFPQTTSTSGSWAGGTFNDQSSWGSNYGAGSCWLMYELTNSTFWLQTALSLQDQFAPNQYRTTSHDVGMIVDTTFGNCYKLTGNTSMPQIIINTAASLSTRFNPIVGMTASWSTRPNTYQVIADNMMNLRILLKAFQLSGNTTFRDIALSHARKNVEYLLRDDYSSYHVMDMSTRNGLPLVRGTQQGYSQSSTWTRGQAWQVYAYSFLYQMTGLEEFKDTFIGVTDYYISMQLPSPIDNTYVPVWDFSDPALNKPRDTSAAAPLLTGLLSWAEQEQDPLNSVYFAKADALLRELSQPPYINMSNTTWQAILQQGARDVPSNNFGTGISWGDYYYLEGIIKYQNLVNQYYSA